MIWSTLELLVCITPHNLWARITHHLSKPPLQSSGAKLTDGRGLACVPLSYVLDSIEHRRTLRNGSHESIQASKLCRPCSHERCGIVNKRLERSPELHVQVDVETAFICEHSGATNVAFVAAVVLLVKELHQITVMLLQILVTCIIVEIAHTHIRRYP